MQALTIPYGEITRVTGLTKPGALVNVYRFSQPSTTFRRVSTVTANLAGIYTYSTTLSANSRFYVVVPDLGQSPIVLQNVRSVISMTATRQSADTYVFSGRVDPVHYGQLVTVYYRTGRNTKAVFVRTRANRYGDYSVTRTVLASGRHTYTVFGHVGSSIVRLGNNSVDWSISTRH